MKTTIQTTGMHCASCEMLISDCLLDAGATVVKADHKTGKVTIEHDASLTKKRINEVIMQEGYGVRD